jgi:MFS family permease
VEDAGVLVPLGRAVHERQRRHRHSRAGIEDVFRYVRRQRGRRRGICGTAEHLQPGRRFFWSSVSDYTGRRTVYCIYFLLGAFLYCAVPWTQYTQNKALFFVVTAIIITMYGGGFATIPAYLRDLFGSYQVGAIHGRLITAWSVAALLGPSLVNYISTAKIEAGVPKAEAYSTTMFLMAGLLMIGLIANLLLRPVDSKYHVTTSPKT